MILTKTERGRALLSDRRALSPRERQLMVLADGRRSAAELGRWLGFSVEPLAQRLLQDGYLACARSVAWEAGADRVPASAAPPARTAGKRPDATDGGAAIAPAAVAPPREAASGSAPRRGSRRSLAASKMYVVGLMQMLRDADAASLAVTLHCADEAEDLVVGLAAALTYLHRRSGGAYATRVAYRLMEVIPHALVPRLGDALNAAGAAQLGAVVAAEAQVADRPAAFAAAAMAAA